MKQSKKKKKKKCLMNVKILFFSEINLFCTKQDKQTKTHLWGPF